jgi:tRNA dimethylallyltransferase
MNLPKLICIVGPTASGKTALAIALAKKFNGEIVSADSRQVYRGMDIGTAKPNRVEQKSAKHFLFDLKNPDQPYTVGQYKKDALRAISQITRAGKMPFLVGGTGLYVWAVTDNLEFPRVKPNRNLRKKLERLWQTRGLHYLFGKLTTLDPEAAHIVDPRNPRRVIRALEVTIASKKPFTKQRRRGAKLVEPLLVGLNLPADELKQRIRQHTKLMLRRGLVAETKKLVKKYGFRRVPFDAIGYRESIDFLQGRLPLAELENEINKNTWRYAKRQMTWFKKMPVTWIKRPAEAKKLIRRFLRS